MELKKFEYEVRAAVSFTGKEIKDLRTWSLNHYDGHCRQVSVNGFLNALNNYWVWEHNPANPLIGPVQIDDADPALQKSVEIVLSGRDLDTLMKIAEAENAYRLVGGTPLLASYGHRLRKIYQEMIGEHNDLAANRGGRGEG